MRRTRTRFVLVHRDGEADLKLQQSANHLHALGPRFVYELLREIVAGGDLWDSLEAYDRIPRSVLPEPLLRRVKALELEVVQ